MEVDAVWLGRLTTMRGNASSALNGHRHYNPQVSYGNEPRGLMNAAGYLLLPPPPPPPPPRDERLPPVGQ